MGKHLFSAVLIGAIACGSSAWAETRSERFVDLMSFLPDVALGPAPSGQPEFVDFAAARAITEAYATAHPDALRPDALRIISGPFGKAPQGQDWTTKVGFSTADLEAAAFIDAPPDRQLALLLSSEAIPRIAPALLANGYAQTEEPGFPAFWRGEDDYVFDMAWRDPADPFSVPVPKSSRIAFDGEVLLHSPSWPGLKALFATAETNPALTAFASVIDLPDWGDRKLVQAVIFSDPGLFVSSFTPDPALMPTPIEPKGIPAWHNLMLADLGSGTRDLTLVALLYPSKDDAEIAATTLNAEFGGMPLFTQNQTLAEATGPGSASVVGDGPFVTVYAIETEPQVATPGMLRNRAFQVLLNAAYSRALPLLAPMP